MILANVRASLGRQDAQLALQLVGRGSRAELERAEGRLRDEGLDALDLCYLDQLFLVELCDLIRLEDSSAGERQLRVFPGDGARGDDVVELIRRLRVIGFHGGFCLGAGNDDYAQLPADFVAERAMASLRWLLALLRHVDLPRRRFASGRGARPRGG